MTQKIDTFIPSLLKQSAASVRLYPWGGRYVDIEGKRFSLNQIVKELAERIPKMTEGTRLQTIKKIEELDACHPEDEAFLLIRLLTAVRQLFGNMFYRRRVELRKLRGMPAPKSEVPQKDPPQIRTSTPPAGRITQPAVPNSQEKLGPVARRPIRSSTPTTADRYAVYRKQSFDEEMDPASRMDLFGPSKNLLDTLLDINEIRGQERVDLLSKFRAKSDFMCWKELVNRDLFVKGFKDALIYGAVTNKTPLLEDCLSYLQPDAVNLILNRYLQCKTTVDTNDATLEFFVKHYANLYASKKTKEANQIDKEQMIEGICRLLPSGTFSLNWLLEPLRILREHQILTDTDIQQILDAHAKAHSHPTDVYTLLQNLLRNSSSFLTK